MGPSNKKVNECHQTKQGPSSYQDPDHHLGDLDSIVSSGLDLFSCYKSFCSYGLTSRISWEASLLFSLFHTATDVVLVYKCLREPAQTPQINASLTTINFEASLESCLVANSQNL